MNKSAINSITNTKGAYKGNDSIQGENPWKQKIGNDEEDLTWLI
jgi:hypothetical protein